MSRSNKTHRRTPERRDRARKPVWQRKNCNACGRRVILAEEDADRGRLAGALLETGEDVPEKLKVLVRTVAGTVVRDPGRTLEGSRYAWHHCPVRNANAERQA